MKLLGARVIIIPEAATDRTAGGIYLPDQLKEERNVGIVALTGEGVPTDYQHRRVLFNPLAKNAMIYEGLEAIMIYVHDIIAILS